jgi:hypothetical protein
MISANNFELTLLVVNGVETLGIFVIAWLLKDMRDRIFRLENHAMDPREIVHQIERECMNYRPKRSP